MAIKFKECHKSKDWSFALQIMNPYEEDRDDKHCLLHVAAFGHSLWFKIPQLFKPKEKWVDLSQYDWATERNGKKGYMDEIRRSYGFNASNEALHVYYGIQPGEYISGDPKNSDHSKCFFYPWRYEIVKHDLLYPNGNLYWSNVYVNGRRVGRHLHWYEIFGPKDDVAKQAEEIFSDVMHITHYTRSGAKQDAKIRLTGEVREWRRWFGLWPFNPMIQRVVDCESDVELGERAGSWKGGLMGWSCEWKEGETMREAFKRWYDNWDGR